MRRQGGKRQGKEVQADALGEPPCLVVDPILALRDRQIVLEHIDPDLIGTAELDAIERYFSDLVMEALG